MPKIVLDTKMIDGKLCVPGKKIAEIFNISLRMVDRWVNDNGCPRAGLGYYSVDDVKKWYEQSGLKQKRETREAPKNPLLQTTDDKKLSFAQSKIKYDSEYKRLMSEKLELENKIKRGDYLSREEVVKVLSGFFAALKRSFHSFGRTTSIYLSPFVDEATARKMDNDYRLMIDDFLRRISEGTNYADIKKARKPARR